MLSGEICLMKSLGPDYFTMYSANLKTEVSQFFTSTMRKMKEEVQFNKGSHKLKPLQPEDYLQPSRCSTSLQLMKKINLRRESEPEISSGKK